MRLSDAGRAMIKAFEGRSLTAYPDADGYSIGYGHYGAKPGDTITAAEADRLFDQDVSKYESGVTGGLGGAPTAPHQFDAFVSLAYNIGLGGTNTGFLASTALRLHRQGDHVGAADAILMWNKSQGKVHQGLVARRARERAVYLEGHDGGVSLAGGGGASGGTSAPPPPSSASSPASSAGPLLVGVGVFFCCPQCGHAVDSITVRIPDRRMSCARCDEEEGVNHGNGTTQSATGGPLLDPSR